MAIEPYTKMASEVVRSVFRQMGDESGVQITEEDVIRWINEAQNRIVSENPELNQAFTRLSVKAATNQYSVLQYIPNIMRIHSLHYMGRYLETAKFEEAQRLITNHENIEPGEPHLWFEFGGIIYLSPTPAEDQDNALTIFYTKSPTIISSLNESLGIPDKYFNSIIDYCLSRAYELDENGEFARLKNEQFDRVMSTFKLETGTSERSYPTIRDEGW